MGKKTTNQHAARAMMNVLHHMSEDRLPEVTVISRARAFTKAEHWNAMADWDLAFSRLVSSGRVRSSSHFSGVVRWSSTQLPLVVKRRL
jgi:hypothetical protein